MGSAIGNAIGLSFALVVVVGLTIWFVVAVVRAGTMSPRAAVKFQRRQEARMEREGEKILQAAAKLDAEGWKP